MEKTTIKILITGPQQSGKTLVGGLLAYTFLDAGFHVEFEDFNVHHNPKFGPSGLAIAKRALKQLGTTDKSQVVIETSNQPEPEPKPMSQEDYQKTIERLNRKPPNPEGLQHLSDDQLKDLAERMAKLERWAKAGGMGKKKIAEHRTTLDKAIHAEGLKEGVDLKALRTPSGLCEAAPKPKRANWSTQLDVWLRNQNEIEGLQGTYLEHSKGISHPVAIVRKLTHDILEIKVWDDQAARTTGASGYTLARIRPEAFTPYHYTNQPSYLKPVIKEIWRTSKPVKKGSK